MSYEEMQYWFTAVPHTEEELPFPDAAERANDSTDLDCMADRNARYLKEKI